MRAIVLPKFGPSDVLIPDGEGSADRLITDRTVRRRFYHRNGVLKRRILSVMIALTLACVLSSAVNATDGGNGSKSSADSTDSEGLEESYVEIEKTKLHVVQGGAGLQTVVMIHGNAGNVRDFEYGVAE